MENAMNCNCYTVLVLYIYIYKCLSTLAPLYWKLSVKGNEVKWSEVELRWSSWGQKYHTR